MNKIIIIAALLAGLTSCRKNNDAPTDKERCPIYDALYIASVDDVIRYHGANCDSLYMDVYLGNYEAWTIGEFLHVDTAGYAIQTEINSMHTINLSKGSDGKYYIDNFWGNGEKVQFYAVNSGSFFIKEFPAINRGGGIYELVGTDGKTEDLVVKFIFKGGTYDHVHNYIIDDAMGHYEYNYNIQFIKK